MTLGGAPGEAGFLAIVAAFPLSATLINAAPPAVGMDETKGAVPPSVIVCESVHRLKVMADGWAVGAVGAVAAGATSPVGPRTVTNGAVSIVRCVTSVTMKETLDGQASAAVAWNTPPLVSTIPGDTLANCGRGETTV